MSFFFQCERPKQQLPVDTLWMFDCHAKKTHVPKNVWKYMPLPTAGSWRAFYLLLQNEIPPCVHDWELTLNRRSSHWSAVCLWDFFPLKLESAFSVCFCFCSMNLTYWLIGFKGIGVEDHEKQRVSYVFKQTTTGNGLIFGVHRTKLPSFDFELFI